MPRIAVHAPNHSCFNFPVCSKQQFRPASAPASLFCKTCLEQPVCQHPSCSHHACKDISTKRKHWRFHGLCVMHVRDPCYCDSLEWTPCRNASVGCQYLSRTLGASYCLACHHGDLPCKHAESGCKTHTCHTDASSVRRSCSLHNHALCPFDPQRAAVKCSAQYCPQLRTSGSLCELCAGGFVPCALQCTRRVPGPGHAYCTFCSRTKTATDHPTTIAQPMSAAEPVAASRTPSVGDVAIQTLCPASSAAIPLCTLTASLVCGTEGCHHIVRESTVCIKCATGCTPCPGDKCKRRLPGDGGVLCNTCLRKAVPSVIEHGRAPGTARKRLPTNPPAQTASTKRPRTSRRRLSLPVCVAAPLGCSGHVLKASGQYCKGCLAKGPPCKGPASTGCSHLIHGRHPRRAMPGNDGMCYRCAPQPCKIVGCRKPVHRAFEKAGFCRKHGRDSRGFKRRFRETDAANLTRLPDQDEQELTNAKRFQRRSTCIVRWCNDRARIRIQLPDSDRILRTCHLHASWYCLHDATTGQGFRSGRWSAKLCLDDYVCGHAEVSALSPDGLFDHACDWCGALHFSSEMVHARGVAGQRAHTRCCRHGIFADIPVPTPAPTCLAELLSGHSATAALLQTTPFSEVGLLGSPLTGRAKQASKRFTSLQHRFGLRFLQRFLGDACRNYS